MYGVLGTTNLPWVKPPHFVGIGWLRLNLSPLYSPLYVYIYIITDHHHHHHHHHQDQDQVQFNDWLDHQVKYASSPVSLMKQISRHGDFFPARP